MNFNRDLLQAARRDWRLLALTVFLGVAGGVVVILQARTLSAILAAVFIGGQTRAAIAWMFIPLLVILAARALISWGADAAAGHLAVSVKENLRRQLIDHLFQLGPAFTRGENSGELANTALQGLESLDAYFSQYLPQVALAGLVGWSTAGAALRPLDRVTETAVQITRADDLSRRIPLAGPPRGEVGRLSQAFNETLERLEGLFETQRRFLADVSHELRTPLTTIGGNVDLIRRMKTADPESLEAIKAEVDRMSRMVNDLLLLAQAESGRLPLAMEPIELDTLMLEVFKQAKVLALNGVRVEIGREEQVQVRGDKDRLKQVFLNLVANALEHSGSGGVVTLSLGCVEGWARLTVSDTGRGMPQEELPHIFERFYRIDPARKRSDLGGAGLGLSIAYWITRSHNGRIEVASEVGKGTTFSVWLPRVGENSTEPLLRTA